MSSNFPSIKQRLHRFASLSLYWRVILLPRRSQVLALLFLGLMGALLEISVLGMTVPILDLVARPDQIASNRIAAKTAQILAEWGYATDLPHLLFALIVLASLLFLVRSAFEVAQQYWEVAISLRIKLSTRGALFRNTLRTPYEVLSTQGRGAILNDIVQPSDAMYVSVKNVVVFLTGIINAAVLTGLMLYLSATGTALIAGFAILGIFGWRKLLTRLSAARGHIIYDVLKSQTKIEVDAVDGIRVVKSFVLEPTLSQQHQTTLDAEIAPTLEVTLFRNGPTLGNEIIACLMLSTLGALTFLWPTTGLTLSTLVAMLLALRRLTPVISRITASTVELGKYRRGLEVYDEVSKRPLEPTTGVPVPELIDQLQIERLNFRYQGKSSDALQNISLHLKQGTVTALVGPTGSGKTTLANLLMGLYTAPPGSLWVNGIDLHTINLPSWRSKIGYVSQDVFLFNSTLAENIALWDPTVSFDQIRQAAQTAQLDEFVMGLPAGYDTLVGDRGLRLSGGQCQRVAIARALLRHPNILIFDEATSALDNLTEKAVYQAIQILRQRSIVLVIAHRLSTIKEADQILVLKEGRMLGMGRHEDLLQSCPLYASLYRQDAVVSAN